LCTFFPSEKKDEPAEEQNDEGKVEPDKVKRSFFYQLCQKET